MPSFNIGRALEAGYAPKEVLRYLAERGYQSPYEGSDEDVVRQHMAAGNRPYVTSKITYPVGTPLAPTEEVMFQDWAKRNNVRLDPGWNEDYDMRGLWKANPGAVPDARGHWPDTYKLPNHPTFSDQSQYATPDAPHWYGQRLIDPQGRLVADEAKSPLDLPNLSGPPLPVRLRDLVVEPEPRRIGLSLLDLIRRKK